jgi:hypothetical protein
MKTVLRLVCVLCIFAFYFNSVQAAPVSADESSFQLTIELRDGSRVVGKTLEDVLSFHSSALGDMKLSWAGIRSIEYAADTDTARLTATNGDGFAIQLAADTLSIQTGFGKTDLPVKLIRSIKVSPPKLNVAAAPTAAGESGSRLTIELWDGSHVVGKGLDDSVSFHSTAMGELKLAWSGIRSIEYATANTDTAQLTATNGDVYEVQFTADSVRVETSFGKNELPVKLIRSIKVSTMTSPGQLHSGLVALWSGEGNANDSVGGNNGTAENMSYTAGKVGQTFDFNGANFVQVPDAPDLHFTDAMTVGAWVNLRAFSGSIPEAIISKIGGPNLNQASYVFAVDQTTHQPYFAIVTTDGVTGTVRSSIAITANQWTHIAGTYDGSTIKIYVNGQLEGTTPWNQPIFQGNNPLVIGCGLQNYSVPTAFFNGLIDEVGLYNRALSDSEIQETYTQQQ